MSNIKREITLNRNWNILLAILSIILIYSYLKYHNHYILVIVIITSLYWSIYFILKLEETLKEDSELTEKLISLSKLQLVGRLLFSRILSRIILLIMSIEIRNRELKIMIMLVIATSIIYYIHEIFRLRRVIKSISLE